MWGGDDSDEEVPMTRMVTPSSLAGDDEELLNILWKCCDATADVNLRTTFNSIDQSGDGVIDEKEFSFFLFKQGLAPTKTEFVKLMKTFDDNGDGSISYKEFSRVMTVFRDSKKKGKGTKWQERLEMKKRQQFRKHSEKNHDAQQKHLAAAAILDAKRKGLGMPEGELGGDVDDDPELAKRVAKVEKLWSKISKYFSGAAKQGGTNVGSELFKKVFREFDSNGVCVCMDRYA